MCIRDRCAAGTGFGRSLPTCLNPAHAEIQNDVAFNLDCALDPRMKNSTKLNLSRVCPGTDLALNDFASPFVAVPR
eukprot:5847518-Amphidinium_carterae.1